MHAQSFPGLPSLRPSKRRPGSDPSRTEERMLTVGRKGKKRGEKKKRGVRGDLERTPDSSFLSSPAGPGSIVVTPDGREKRVKEKKRRTKSLTSPRRSRPRFLIIPSRQDKKKKGLREGKKGGKKGGGPRGPRVLGATLSISPWFQVQATGEGKKRRERREERHGSGFPTSPVVFFPSNPP